MKTWENYIMLLTNVILINLIIEEKENMGQNLCDVVLGKNFLEMTP